MLKFIFLLILFFFWLLFFPAKVWAVVDPASFPNNHFGIHLISPSLEEASKASDLVNSSGGDWGYITVLIESKDRDQEKWQKFFNYLREKHLIPLVRLATAPEGNYWKLPYEKEEIAWADFLDNLNWPIKNRYVIIYNEPNQGQEWAGMVDPASYALVLDKTITALKNKNQDFFVLNAGFDASAPQKPPLFWEEKSFLAKMNETVPGILNKLDGWVSHSYPNPGFAGSPDGFGRGSVRTWAWELQVLKELGVSKNLPVFITETGWKHAEGLLYDKSLPDAETVGGYFKQSFQNVWHDGRIIAVTPFVLNYQDIPFDHFSFKKITKEEHDLKVLGASFPGYYQPFMDILALKKTAGQPLQENKAELTQGEIYHSLVSGESYLIPLHFKNIGQSIWNEKDFLQLKTTSGQKELGIEISSFPGEKKIKPGEEIIFSVKALAPKPGNYHLSLQLFQGGKAFDQKTFDFEVEVKSPVVLVVNSILAFKNNFSGDYLLKMSSDLGQTDLPLKLDSSGQSGIIEARNLLPDKEVRFTLQKAFYQNKSLEMVVYSGLNNLNFGSLYPDFFSALFNPQQLWLLLPFSN